MVAPAAVWHDETRRILDHARAERDRWEQIKAEADEQIRQSGVLITALEQASAVVERNDLPLASLPPRVQLVEQPALAAPEPPAAEPDPEPADPEPAAEEPAPELEAADPDTKRGTDVDPPRVKAGHYDPDAVAAVAAQITANEHADPFPRLRPGAAPPVSYEIIRRWVRAFGSRLVMIDAVPYLQARGYLRDGPASAASAVLYNALAKMQDGGDRYRKTAPGIYEFYMLDGKPLAADPEPGLIERNGERIAERRA